MIRRNAADFGKQLDTNRVAKVGRKVIFIIVIVIVLFWGLYAYRLLSSDLLIDLRTSGGWITPGVSSYHVINSKTGGVTYVLPFAAPLIGYTSQQLKDCTKPYNGFVKARAGKLIPDIAHDIDISGYYDEDTVIFTSYGEQKIYKYSLSGDQCTFLAHVEGLNEALAANGKVFISAKAYGSAMPTTTIFRYYPDSAELVKIKRYVFGSKNLVLLNVLK